MIIDAQSFFLALYPDGLDGAFLEIRKLPSAQQTFASSIEEAVQAATDRTQNVYFGVGLRREPSGKEKDVVAITALWADIDVVKDYGGDWEKAGKVLAAFPIRPSIVVRTANGWHVYWLLKELETVTPANLFRLRGYLLGIAHAVGGDSACRDLSRIMRVPRTLHAKNESGETCYVRDCPTPKPVEVIRFYAERRYNLMDFDPWFIEDTNNGKCVPSVTLDEIPDELPQKFTCALQNDDELRAAWEGERQPPNDQSRSGYDAMLAAMLVAREFADEEIAAVLRHYPHGKASDEKLDYLSRTISHARAFVSTSGDGEDENEQSGEAPDDPSEEDLGEKAGSQADRLVKLCVMEVELFHDQTKAPYARVKVGEHIETWPCRGRAFRRWLSRKLYEAEKKVPRGEAISSALSVIEAKACFEGERHEIHNRVALHDSTIWYDLTDERWRAVRVTPDGWQIIETPPILFVRYEHHAPQVEPIKGGDVHRLFDFVAVTGDGPRLLLLVYLVSCFIPNIPHPVPVLHGPQGSGKSSTFRILRRLIDPSAVEVLSFPRDNNELVQKLAHHWAALFDNISGLQEWQSDTLCRAVTGEGFTKRQLFTDDDDIIYSFRRCVGLNGINVAATRPDLLDRSILIALDRIPPDRRRTETELWAAFEPARPHILGGIFDALSRAMQLLPSVHLSVLPRMADFARWGCAIAQALGYTHQDFLRAYGENIAAQNDEVLQGHPVAAAVLALMDDREIWRGSPSELLEKLVDTADVQKIDTRAKIWPKAAHVLTRRINEVRPNLQDAGIAIEYSHGKSNIVTIRRTDNSVGSVVASNAHQDNGLHADATPTLLIPPAVASAIASAHNSNKNNITDATDATDATFGTLVDGETGMLLGGRL